ncbi:MAG: septum formation protein Maf [Prevotella sp.]|nr:septum formation protein Maf [Prevotella sp.]MCF0208373.1 septum formation protein Maf [Bacteroidaceae bacterium]
MKKLILASNSPRRKELLAGLDIPFEVRIISGIDETHPEGVDIYSIPEHLAQRKAQAYANSLADDEVILTADTVVILNDEIIEKPTSLDNAKEMLRKLSGHSHSVVTGVCIGTKEDLTHSHFSVLTEVRFKTLTDEEIDYYVETYKPLDKAGAYGIQEWIGYVGVTGIDGSFYNVMGLPVQRIYPELIKIINT